MAEEKRPKIRCGEIEEGEVFKYKGGLFKVLRVFKYEVNPDKGSSKCLVIKSRKVKNPTQGNYATPVGGEAVFRHRKMVRRYEPPVTFQ